MAILVCLILPVRFGIAAAAEISCTATQDFYCDTTGCTSNNEPNTIEVGVSVDLETGAGELCEYSQCREFTAARFGSGAMWQAQLTLGPSNFVLAIQEQGIAVDEEDLQPTGAQLAIDLAKRSFVVSQHSDVTVSGYFGPCEIGEP